MRLHQLTLLCFLSLHIFGQETPRKNYAHIVEQFLIEQKLDSAAYFLDSIANKEFQNKLHKFVYKKEISYKDYNAFLYELSSRQSIDYKDISKFINANIEEPNTEKINVYYAEIKWLQVAKLRDEVGIAEASVVQKNLEQYVNQFNDASNEVLKIKTKIKTHPIILYQIKGDLEQANLLLEECLKIATQLEDKELQIIFLYHLTDSLVLEGKLQEYIDVSEKSLALEHELEKPTSYYYSIIEHLIDAYVYKGGHNKRVLKLINILYDNANTTIHSYSLYAQIIASLDKNAPLKYEILNKFQVASIAELVAKFKRLGENLNPNDFFNLINTSSKALSQHDYDKLALQYKDEAIKINRKIYSKDLSESLANFKAEQAIKEKELEVQYEKEQTTLYGIIAALALVMFFVALFVLYKIRNQSNLLSKKNLIIEEALKEKELLIKEVHHRVKNNFQIVSSLLELQTKGIQDEKALQLANEGKNRVMSMALIHQKLYQNENGLIDFDEYIKLLVKELSSLYATKNKVNTIISADSIHFDVDTAIPLGLIVNEIITNSYKYAFKNDKENTLSVKIEKDVSEHYKLVIEDNGPGLDNNFEVKKAKSLGLRLVNRLVKQLHGSLSLTNVNGARFEIFFKDTNARHLVN